MLMWNLFSLHYPEKMKKIKHKQRMQGLLLKYTYHYFTYVSLSNERC